MLVAMLDDSRLVRQVSLLVVMPVSWLVAKQVVLQEVQWTSFS